MAASPGLALASSAISNAAVTDPPVMQESRIRLVLGDELTLFREGLAAICDLSPRCEVVGQCSDGAMALRLIQDLSPDIAVLDINLTGLHTIELIRQVKAAGLPTRVAVLSARTDRKTVLEALRGGASAFLLKSGPARHLIESFEQMMEGTIYLSPLLNLDEIFFSPEKPGPDDPLDALSPREFQVFSLLVEGVRAKEIAARLCLSPKTVDTYRSSMMEKLDIHDIAGLVKYAMQRDVISRG